MIYRGGVCAIIPLWPKFPIWYHLYFLVSLVAISVILGRLVGAEPAAIGQPGDPK